ncbi:hypothetical protein ACQJBY_048270 [Aegilops geniculata]
MGDRGGGRSGGWRDNTARGGFGGGRKAPLPNQSRHMVWQRPDPPPATSGDSRSGGGEVADRWEAAARAMSGASKEKMAGAKEPPPPPASGQAVTKGNIEICINCSLPDYVVWPSLPHIVPLEEGSVEGGENCSVYTVESPSGSPIHDNMSQEEEVPRRQKQKLERVEDVAANRMRKRNLEGLLKGEDKEKLQAGVKRLTHAAAALADRSFPRGRLLLGDSEGTQIG